VHDLSRFRIGYIVVDKVGYAEEDGRLHGTVDMNVANDSRVL